jgi:hypothetical protein
MGRVRSREVADKLSNAYITFCSRPNRLLKGFLILQSLNLLFDGFDLHLQLFGIFPQLVSLLGLCKEASSEIMFMSVRAAPAIALVLPIMRAATTFVHHLSHLLSCI